MSLSSSRPSPFQRNPAAPSQRPRLPRMTPPPLEQARPTSRPSPRSSPPSRPSPRSSPPSRPSPRSSLSSSPRSIPSPFGHRSLAQRNRTPTQRCSYSTPTPRAPNGSVRPTLRSALSRVGGRCAEIAESDAFAEKGGIDPFAPASEKKMRKEFDEFDKDGNGKISGGRSLTREGVSASRISQLVWVVQGRFRVHW
jgi:hypothetical protein